MDVCGRQLHRSYRGNRGVFVETAKADFNKLFEVLVGPR
jgi:roadblock/LC7 domain-containing protein